MTSTIFLSISRFISIFALFRKQSFKIVIKISSYPKHVHTSLPPCWLPSPFDAQLQRSQLLHDSHKANVSLTHGYRTTVANTRFLQTGQPHVILYSNLHLSDTSINIRLTHSSRTTVTNTKFDKKGQAYQKSCQKMSFGFPIKSHPIQKKSLYMHGHPNKLPPNGGYNILFCG